MPEKEVTLAIRINTTQHAQLTWIADLRRTSLKTECLRAVDAWIASAKQDPDLMARASMARKAIEEEARTRQAAINDLFADTTEQAPGPETPSSSELPAPETVPDPDPPSEGTEQGAPSEVSESEQPQGARRPRNRKPGQPGGGELTNS